MIGYLQMAGNQNMLIPFQTGGELQVANVTLGMKEMLQLLKVAQ